MAKYINADEFLNLFHATMESKGLSETDSWFCYRDLERVISATQTADVREVKRGHWVDDNDPSEWTCSECHYRVMRYNNTAFCPNCGADMRDGEVVSDG